MDGPCQLRRQPHKARNRRERELQADARDGVWIFEQDQQQRKAEQDAAQSAVSKRLLEIEKKVSNVLPAAPGEVKDEKKTKELFGQLF